MNLQFKKYIPFGLKLTAYTLSRRLLVRFISTCNVQRHAPEIVCRVYRFTDWSGQRRKIGDAISAIEQRRFRRRGPRAQRQISRPERPH